MPEPHSNLFGVVRGALVASPKFKQAHADALNSLEEQYERLMQLAQSVRDSWLLIEADDAHLMHSCRKLDDWLVRYVVSNEVEPR